MNKKCYNLLMAQPTWKPRKKQQKIWKLDFLTNFSNLILIFTLGFLFLLFGAVIYFATQIPSPEDLTNRSIAQATKIYDKGGELLYDIYEDQNRTPIKITEIPEHVKQATISIEDKDFYKHQGFDIVGIVRSFVKLIIYRRVEGGGSTLTQQLVKNALLTSDKSFFRKYQEVILAEEIERRYTKNEILEMYLNSVYFGEGAFGIEEASQTYFGKKAINLTLAESSLLAGLLPSPSKLSPLNGNKDLAIFRQRHVLKEMLDEKYISKKEYLLTESEKLIFKPTININYKAPHFALMVRDILIEKFGEERISRSGFKVKTTIDMNWQEYAEKVVRDQVEKLKASNVTNGAAVVMDPKTGEIKAMVGSIDWYDNNFGKVNMATTPRQTGSAFKPVVYVTAFKKQIITPATILKDRPTTFGKNYSPQNYDRKFRGNVTARRALANSLNVPSVDVLSKVGVEQVIDMGKRLGITTLGDPSQYGLSLVLGTAEIKLLDLTSAYGVFANNGYKNNPVSILSITDKRGQTVFEYAPNPEFVLGPENTFLISSILSDNKTRSEVFGNVLDISKPASVKTGTTEDYKDSWTVGYTPSLAVGAWVGNNDNKPMDNIAGSLGAAPIWKSLMEKFLEKKQVEEFEKPPGVISLYICRDNGLPLKTGTSDLKEYFVEGTVPSQYCIPKAPTLTPTPN